MRALDGTYWRVKDCYKGHAHTHSCYLRNDDDVSLVMFRNHDTKPENIQKGSKLVRIRPRTSIVRAVRLLTEARKQGVELWMRSSPEVWGWLSYDDRGWIHMLSDGRAVGFNLRPSLTLAKWIVATPEDARRIDAKRGS